MVRLMTYQLSYRIPNLKNKKFSLLESIGSPSRRIKELEVP
jgi:hypothetical protein